MYIFFIFLVVLDQWSKYWARSYLSEHGSISIIQNFFHLTYVENRGIAFGLFQGKSLLFIIFTSLAIVLLVNYLRQLKMRRIPQLVYFELTIMGIIAGAVGNLIDRITFGFVTDMIDVRGIWSFVFNLADIYVVLGTLGLCYLIIIYDK